MRFKIWGCEVPMYTGSSKTAADRQDGVYAGTPSREESSLTFVNCKPGRQVCAWVKIGMESESGLDSICIGFASAKEKLRSRTFREAKPECANSRYAKLTC